MRYEPGRPQHPVPCAVRHRVGDREDVEEPPGVFLERLGRRQLGRHPDGTDDQPLAGRRHQPAQRLEAGVAPPVLVGRDNRLRGTRSPCQLLLGKTVPFADSDDQLRRRHPVEYIGLCMFPYWVASMRRRRKCASASGSPSSCTASSPARPHSQSRTSDGSPETVASALSSPASRARSTVTSVGAELIPNASPWLRTLTRTVRS